MTLMTIGAAAASWVAFSIPNDCGLSYGLVGLFFGFFFYGIPFAIASFIVGCALGRPVSIAGSVFAAVALATLGIYALIPHAAASLACRPDL